MANGAVITNTGKNFVLNRIFASTKTVVDTFEIGTGTTTPDVTDTALETRVPITTDTTLDSCDATTGWANAGIGDAETLNTTAGERIEGTGCLNLPTTGAAGTAGWSKTVAAWDFSTAQDTVNIWYYIADQSDLTTASDAVTIYLGDAGAANAYLYDFADTAISSGWNFLVCITGSETSTVGAPVNTQLDFIQIEVKLDTDQVTNDMRMDFWALSRAADYTENFLTGYPTYDTGNRRATVRCNISSSQANGHNLTEIGLENTESTPELLSHTVHTAISKSSKDEIIYQNVYNFD